MGIIQSYRSKFVFALFILVLGLAVFGPYSIARLDNSTTPTSMTEYQPSDLFIVKHLNGKDYRIGDIVVYTDYSGKDVIHRIQDIYYENNYYYFIIKGDNPDNSLDNVTPDTFLIPEELIKGKVIAHIHHAASPIILSLLAISLVFGGFYSFLSFIGLIMLLILLSHNIQYIIGYVISETSGTEKSRPNTWLLIANFSLVLLISVLIAYHTSILLMLVSLLIAILAVVIKFYFSLLKQEVIVENSEYDPVNSKSISINDIISSKIITILMICIISLSVFGSVYGTGTTNSITGINIIEPVNLIHTGNETIFHIHLGINTSISTRSFQDVTLRIQLFNNSDYNSTSHAISEVIVIEIKASGQLQYSFSIPAFGIDMTYCQQIYVDSNLITRSGLMTEPSIYQYRSGLVTGITTCLS